MIERQSKNSPEINSRVVVVENRNSGTLSEIVKRYISKNCRLLISDEWRGYYRLQKDGYNI